jgi:GxxExxY protein
MTENEIAKIVVNTSFDIHKKLGPGLLESVYEEILCLELKRKGLYVERQKEISIYWGDVKIEKSFFADIILEQSLIIEIKSVEKLANVHYKQLLTYLKLAEMNLGLLINFNEALIKDGIKRIVNKL